MDPDVLQALRGEVRTLCAWYSAFDAYVWARCGSAHALGLPIDEIADFMGVSRATVYRRLRLVEDGMPTL